MEQHHEGLARLAVDQVDVDEIAIGRLPAFAAEGHGRLGETHGRVNRLRVAATPMC